MTASSKFEQLLAEGNSEPTEGWDFSWFKDRATEERPSWKYSQALCQRVARADAVFDVQTGGGERLAEILSQLPTNPRVIVASESWSDNVKIAKQNLHRFDVSIVEIEDKSDFPFPDESFDLVSSRHPTLTLWTEIARVLQPGGTYFSQQVGKGTNSELTNFMMGPQPVSDSRSARRAAAIASSVGLNVIDMREESLPVVFFDVGAVVYFLRKVIWTVPDFTVEKYKKRLFEMHKHIEKDGGFLSHSQRFLIEAKKRNST
ncbi:MAG TPA: class I SAM-dependent methyltransferase [Acidimicrobiales bacterium]|nr:class I SAM-dependent methyltransferase [Acidimicrobiales bacterium]